MSDYTPPKTLGRYEIIRELGRGAMGVVYEGRDPNIDRRVAIKTARRDVLEKSSRTDELMERFLQEARAAGALNHPNIVTIFDADEEDGTAYIAMEYVDGEGLDVYLRKNPVVAPEEAVDIITTICSALAPAHEKGIVHRDIKPANIMLTPDGNLKITDFGIAHVTDSGLTQDGSLLGTPHYMSPEQFMAQHIDGRADMFAVAILLYEMLTGEKPFPGKGFNAVMHKVLNLSPVPPAKLNFSINPVLDAVIMKGLAKSRNDRYENISAFAAALRESLKENPDPAVTKVAPTRPDPDATVINVEQNVAIQEARSTASPKTEPDAATAEMQGQPAPQKEPQIPSAGKTVPGKPPPDAALDLPAKTTSNATKTLTMAIASLALLTFAIGAGYAFINKDEGSTPLENTVNPADIPEAYYKEIIYTVYLCDDADQYDNWQRGDKHVHPDWTEFDGNVKVVNVETGETLKAPPVEDGEFRITFNDPIVQIELTFTQDGYIPQKFTLPPPTKPSDILTRTLVLPATTIHQKNQN